MGWLSSSYDKQPLKNKKEESISMKLPVSRKKLLVLVAAIATSIAAYAQTAVPTATSVPETTNPGTRQWQVTAEQRATAAIAAQNGIHVSELRADAPVSYRVKPGDTLWAISGYFLKNPWKWPALWGMNQNEIRNPHLIFPGQVLILTRNGDRAMLSVGNEVGPGGTVHLAPRVRSTPLDETAIPVLPPEAVIPFLNHGIIIPRNEFENAPRIVALPERRLLLTEGDKVYVRGNIDPDQKIYLAYTSPEPIRDPVTNDVLGFQANYLGKLQFSRAGVPSGQSEVGSLETTSTFIITDAKQEMRVGDRLAPASSEQELLTDFTPSAAPAGIKGRVVHIYGGNSFRHASLYQVILLSQGHLDGLERGNVVALWRPGEEVRDRTAPNTGWDTTRISNRQNTMVMTPDERYGLAMVFRTYDHLSYAIIMQATDSVELGDNFTTP